MPASQTESLIKLLASTTSGRGKANVRIPEFKNRRTAGTSDYRFRTNSVIVKNSINTAGEVVRVQLPSFSTCVGEMFLEITGDAIDNSALYDPYFGAKVIKRCILRHSDQAYSYEPEKVWPILLSNCRNKEDKETRANVFGASVAAGDAQTIVIPLLQPFSQHFSAEYYGAEPVRHGRRDRPLFPAYALKENVVFEIEFQPVSHFQSGSSNNGAGLSSVSLMWEELVASPDTYNRLKKAMSKVVVAPDFTHLDLTNNGSEEAYQITALMSRAPTMALWFDLQLDSDNSRNPFSKIDKVVFEELECDGRILISDRDDSEAVKRYRDILEGAPTNRGGVFLPCLSFGNDGGYSVSHASAQLSNTACNSVTLRTQCAAACTGCLTAEHQRQYMVSNGTITSVNVY